LCGFFVWQTEIRRNTGKGEREGEKRESVIIRGGKTERDKKKIKKEKRRERRRW
jgi:hypothetical protein